MMRRGTNRMRKLRTELRNVFGKEYTVRACARRAGISESAWWSYETGVNVPSVEAATSIARVLGVTVEQVEFRRANAPPR
jgi:transcriptional regulator with XRE-family HTH domain